MLSLAFSPNAAVLATGTSTARQARLLWGEQPSLDLQIEGTDAVVQLWDVTALALAAGYTPLAFIFFGCSRFGCYSRPSFSPLVLPRLRTQFSLLRVPSGVEGAHHSLGGARDWSGLQARSFRLRRTLATFLQVITNYVSASHQSYVVRLDSWPAETCWTRRAAALHLARCAGPTTARCCTPAP